MPALKKIYLAAVLTALTAPAWAALTYTATGSYNLGSASGPGGTSAASTECETGNPGAGNDVLEFNGSGVNNVGLHSYSCNFSGFTSFGSRSSGTNTYFADGSASVVGTISTAENDSFSFFINSGEVGAFGSTGFTLGEFQKAKLTIKLVIDGTVYLDEAWSAEVGIGGAITNSYESHGSSSVGSTILSGAGYYSYGVLGGSYSFDLGAAGDHDISYTMTSEASGNILTTGVCTAVLQGGRNQEGVATLNAEGDEGPVKGEPFAAYCGAGARTGDPFSDPIATALPPGQLPEPMTAGLALTALLAAAGVRRRNSQR